MAANGHNLTVLSPNEVKNPLKNVHYILIEGLYGENYKELAKSFFTMRDEVSPLMTPGFFSQHMYEACKGNEHRFMLAFTVCFIKNE